MKKKLWLFILIGLNFCLKANFSINKTDTNYISYMPNEIRYMIFLNVFNLDYYENLLSFFKDYLSLRLVSKDFYNFIKTSGIVKKIVGIKNSKKNKLNIIIKNFFQLNNKLNKYSLDLQKYKAIKILPDNFSDLNNKDLLENINQKNKIYLQSENKVILDMLLKKFKNCNQDFILRLIYAIKDFNIDLEFKDFFGKTLLLNACESGYFNLYKALIIFGANFNAVDSILENILFKAIDGNNLEIVKDILINNKNLDINAINSFTGITALQKAVKLKRTEIVEFLLNQKDIKVDKKNIKNRTALYYALKNKYLDIITLLLNFKADLNLIDKKLLHKFISKD